MHHKHFYIQWIGGFMAFEIFSLRDVIDEYNKTLTGKDQKRYRLDEDFDLKSLHSSNVKCAQENFELYRSRVRNNPNISKFSSVHLKREFDEIAKVKGPDFFSRFLKFEQGPVLEYHKQTVAVVKHVNTINAVEFLTNAEFWKTGLGLIQHDIFMRQKVEKLQKMFMQHGRFSSCLNKSFSELYKFLNDWEAYIQDCFREVNDSRTRFFSNDVPPESILVEYEHYLNRQLEITKRERNDLVLHVLERLKLASCDPMLRNTNVLHNVINTLKSIGIFKEGYLPPEMAHDDLSSELFLELNHIVESEIARVSTHASTDLEQAHLKCLQDQFSELPWFAGKLMSGKSIREQLADRCGVLALMPKEESWFNSKKIRYEWFNTFYTQAQIDVSLRYLGAAKEINGPISVELFASYITAIECAEQGFLTESTRIDAAKLEHKEGEAFDFLCLVGGKLDDQKKELLVRKIDLLNFIGVTFDKAMHGKPHEKQQYHSSAEQLSEALITVETLIPGIESSLNEVERLSGNNQEIMKLRNILRLYKSTTQEWDGYKKNNDIQIETFKNKIFDTIDEYKKTKKNKISANRDKDILEVSNILKDSSHKTLDSLIAAVEKKVNTISLGFAGGSKLRVALSKIIEPYKKNPVHNVESTSAIGTVTIRINANSQAKNAGQCGMFSSAKSAENPKYRQNSALTIPALTMSH